MIVVRKRRITGTRGTRLSAKAVTRNSKSNARIKARETEIARRLLLVLDRLPSRALQNFVQNLVDALPRLLNLREVPAAGGRWHSHAANGGVSLSKDSYARVEVVPGVEGTQDRLDLVLPTAPVLVGDQLITSLVFEFKIGAYQLDQLERYAAVLPNSLLMSVSKQPHGLEQLARAVTGATIIFQTWEHLYFAFARVLSGDAAPRLFQVDEPTGLLLNFDHLIAGQDRASFEIESFLDLLLNRDLLPNRDLVLAIPRGAWAASTLQEDPPYYRHPDSWRAGYSYVVSVYRNEIEGIFEVVHSVTTDPVEGTPPPPPPGVDSEKWEQEVAAEPGSRVSILRRLDATDPVLGPYLGRRYEKAGPKGHAAAFVQTHRYIEHPGELKEFFKTAHPAALAQGTPPS
jgi:hypothetical protein